MPKCLSQECDPLDVFSDCGTGVDHDDNVPLDDGVIFLIVAGSVFAIREHKKRSVSLINGN